MRKLLEYRCLDLGMVVILGCNQLLLSRCLDRNKLQISLG